MNKPQRTTCLLATALLLAAASTVNAQGFGFYNAFNNGTSFTRFGFNPFTGGLESRSSHVDPTTGNVTLQASRLRRNPFTGAVEVVTGTENPLTGEARRTVTSGGGLTPFGAASGTRSETYNRFTRERTRTKTYQNPYTGAVKSEQRKYNPLTGKVDRRKTTYNDFTGTTQVEQSQFDSRTKKRKYDAIRSNPYTGAQQRVARPNSFVYDWSTGKWKPVAPATKQPNQ